MGELKPDVDLQALNEWFADIPPGPYDALNTTGGWEVRQIDTDPTNKHHWPYRLCSSISGQTAGCDAAVFNFIAGVINAWPQILDASRTEGRGDQEPVAWRLDEDEIAAALQDSLGPDWTCRDGARAVSQLLAGAAWHPAAEPFFRLAREVITPANGERPWHADSKDWMVVFSFAGQSLTLGDLRRAAVASPIREPEISKAQLVELIMRETTDEITENGLVIGCPNVLVQGCTFIRGHQRGYERPEEAARGFAELIADAILNLASVGGRGEEGSSQSQPVLSPKSDTDDACAICGGSEIVALGNGQYEDCTCAEGAKAGLEKDWPISTDGHHSISNIRRWMARQLMDSGLSEAEALGIVAYHPVITDLSGAQRSEDDHGEE